MDNVVDFNFYKKPYKKFQAEFKALLNEDLLHPIDKMHFIDKTADNLIVENPEFKDMIEKMRKSTKESLKQLMLNSKNNGPS